MTKTYHVYQPRLTDDEVLRLNANGWNSEPKFRLYATITSGTASAYDYAAAARLGMFSHAWTVEADDRNAVFPLANYMGGKGTARKLHDRAKSMSVGDVLIEADDDAILGWSGHVCARVGYEEMNGVALRVVMDHCQMIRDGRGKIVTPEEV